MTKIRNFFEYLLLFAFARFIQRLGLQKARNVAKKIGEFGYRFIRLRKQIVHKNLRESFPEKSDAEIEQIAKAAYIQFTTTFVELLLFPRLTNEDIKNLVEFENIQLLDNALKTGKGALLVGAHFCNWELIGAAISLRHPITFVVGQQENLRADKLLNSFRLNKGIKIIPLRMSLRGVLKTLKANETVALLADQDAHKDGVFVDFFGRKASTPKGPALFSLTSGCPLLACTIIRIDGKFKVIFDEVQKPDITLPEDKFIEILTQAYTRIIEGYVRRFPDHWFWFHKRWKTKPPV